MPSKRQGKKINQKIINASQGEFNKYFKNMPIFCLHSAVMAAGSPFSNTNICTLEFEAKVNHLYNA
jgi:hypothetical protein